MIHRPLAALMALTILASSLGGFASVARAQIEQVQVTPAVTSSIEQVQVTPAVTSSAASPPDTAAQKKPTLPPPPASTPADEVYDSVMVQIMGLFAMLLGIAVVTLDNAVYYTVVDMGKYLKNLSAVGVSWRILRDIGNVILIFGFLVIGISVILDLNIYGYGTKMLPTLLIAAVFLNFSLFISEAVIDAGNLFATQFYTQINGGDPPAPVSYADARGTGISNRIMGQLGLSGIYGDALKLDNDPQHHLLGKGTPWYVGFLGILLFLIAAFVIFSLAFILIARFVILVFLIIVAPIGFAGLAVPKLEKSAREWWAQLFEQTITAPILLLMLYVALAVITDANFLTGLAAPGAKAQWTGFLSGNVDGFAALLLSFLVAMGLLLAVTVLAKRLGAFGADWAMKWGTRLSGMGVAAATVGFVGRNTVGALGHGSARIMRRSWVGRTAVGRAAAGAIEKKIAKASFDVRNTGVAKSGARFGIQLGPGQKGGYTKEREEAVKAYEKAAQETFRDRKKTKEEEERIRQKETARDKAAEEVAPAEAAQAAAAQEHAANTQTREQLEAEKKADRYWETNQENVRRLQEAQQKETDSEAALAAADEQLASARREAARTATAATQTRADIESSIKADTKRRREAYAGRLQGGWQIFSRVASLGLVGGTMAEAARNIRKNAGKTSDEIANEKLLKQLRKAAEKADKEETGEGEKKEKENK